MRKRFIRGGWTRVALVCMGALLLPGCDAVRALPSSGETAKTIEVALFEGGYGVEWHRRVVKEYEATHASSRVQIDLWGDPRVVDKVKPRLLRGDPPDLISVRRLPIWRLIAADKVFTFDEILDGKGYGSDVTWRDLFVPGTLDTYASEGKVYAVPSAFGAWACWYDARLFREHGWHPPKTWAAFNTLCDEIEAAGIAPIAYQGKYPIYGWYTFVSLIQRCGGVAAVNRLNALDPGGFSHPDVVKAARLMQDMALDHFQKGALAMTHTESQLQFVNNHAALIFCGVWLENEMRESTPPGFEMRCFNLPAVEGGKGNPALFQGQGTEFLFVPTDARHPDVAMDVCRYMVSTQQARSMGTEIGVISPLIGATPRDAVGPGLQCVLDMLEGSPGIFQVRLAELVLEWTNQVMLPTMASLLRGEISPEAFCRILDEGVAVARADPDLIIPPYVPYDAVEFGEVL